MSPAQFAELQHAQDTLAVSELRYRRLFETAKDGILILDAATGMVVDVNSFLMDLLGYSHGAFLGKRVWELGFFKDIIANQANFLELQQKEYVRYEDLPLETSDGRRIEVEFVSNVYLVDRHRVIQCNIRDITERKRAERQAHLAHQVLDLLNRMEVAQGDTIRDILLAIKQATAFDAVAIRLREGDDFPYYTTEGFTEDFVRAENSLAVRSEDGKVCRDKDGNLSLECTCGLVLSGRTDPANPLFTLGGSFWTNESFPLLDLLPAQDPRLHPRNRCIHDGYHSVALIPLRSGTTIVGLLQLNDHRPNQFTPERLLFFEGMGASIGIAVARQQAQELQRASELRYRRLFEAAKDGILILDADTGMVVDVNPFLIDLLGYSHAAFLGKKVWELGCLKDIVANQAKFAELQQTEFVRYEDMPMETADGRRIQVGFVSNVYLVNHQKVIQCNIRDITERKKLEAQLLRNQRMESIGTLAGGIAHDLNNILAPIMMSLELLKDQDNDPQQRGEFVALLQHNMQRATDLVKQVLAFGRGIEGQRIPVNLTHILHEIQKVITETFPKNLDAHFHDTNDLWTVTGDATQMHQVLLNLCLNARDAMPHGGQLTVSTENVELDDTYARMSLDAKLGPYVLLTVMDTGTGIPREIQDRIFEPFFTTKELGKGTGLGLSTTFTIVKGHGGFIQLYSELGHGATFRVYLPANPASQTGEHTAAPPPQLPHGHGELVLVVDDEATLRAVIQKTLVYYGYRVLLAAHGQEAVALYAQRRNEVAVVLLDMAMPVMDGPATMILLKAMNPQVRIIASSGYAAEESVAKAKAAGVHHVVPKPYTAETLLKVLAQVLK